MTIKFSDYKHGNPIYNIENDGSRYVVEREETNLAVTVGEGTITVSALTESGHEGFLTDLGDAEKTAHTIEAIAESLGLKDYSIKIRNPRFNRRWDRKFNDSILSESTTTANTDDLVKFTYVTVGSAT